MDRERMLSPGKFRSSLNTVYVTIVKVRHSDDTDVAARLSRSKVKHEMGKR
jgi:hypothetical protein